MILTFFSCPWPCYAIQYTWLCLLCTSHRPLSLEYANKT
jgi:hypothetical protein